MNILTLYRKSDGVEVKCAPEQREILLASKLYSEEKPEEKDAKPEEKEKDAKHAVKK